MKIKKHKTLRMYYLMYVVKRKVSNIKWKIEDTKIIYNTCYIKFNIKYKIQYKILAVAIRTETKQKNHKSKPNSYSDIIKIQLKVNRNSNQN